MHRANLKERKSEMYIGANGVGGLEGKREARKNKVERNSLNEKVLRYI